MKLESGAVFSEDGHHILCLHVLPEDAAPNVAPTHAYFNTLYLDTTTEVGLQFSYDSSSSYCYEVINNEMIGVFESLLYI